MVIPASYRHVSEQKWRTWCGSWITNPSTINSSQVVQTWLLSTPKGGRFLLHDSHLVSPQSNPKGCWGAKPKLLNHFIHKNVVLKTSDDIINENPLSCGSDFEMELTSLRIDYIINLPKNHLFIPLLNEKSRHSSSHLKVEASCRSILWFMKMLKHRNFMWLRHVKSLY